VLYSRSPLVARNSLLSPSAPIRGIREIRGKILV
jgi:hypothetical protein